MVYLLLCHAQCVRLLVPDTVYPGKRVGLFSYKGEVEDVARDVDNRELAGFKPQVSVMAAEKHFQWFMRIFTSQDGPLGCVEDYIWMKEYQKQGAVHWHMLLWIKPGMTPKNPIMAEVPRPPKVDEEHLQEVGTYLRKIVLKMQMHGQCKCNPVFQG